MALSRKYWGFNLYSAVPVPTQSSAVLVPLARLELAHPCGYQILSLGCLPIPSQRQIQLVGDTGLEPARLPAKVFETSSSTIPTIPHMCGFCLLAPQTRSTYAFRGVAHPLSAASRKQLAFPAGSLPSYHPCINLAPHSGPFRASAHDWRASFLASLPNRNAIFRDSLTTYLKARSCQPASKSLTIMTIFYIIA